MHKAEPEEEFAGFIGLSLLESKLLEPYIALRSKFQNKRLGTKAILVVLAKLLTHRTWMKKYVTGVFACVQTRNMQSLALKDKLGMNEVVEQSNPRRKDGVWLNDYVWHTDKITRTLEMRHFVCNSEGFLISLFESSTQPTINKREHLLIDQACDAGLLLNDVEASLQSFCFSFDDGSTKEKLAFRTLKRPGSHNELDEILNVFGDTETMNQYTFETMINRKKHARIKREQLRQEPSFEGMHRTVRWRISCFSESGNGDTSEIFVGFAALSDIGRTLEPKICLHANYRQKGFGSKIFMCFMMKLLKHKPWLQETFAEILVTVHAENCGSLALKDKLLQGLDTEELCGESDDGLWTCKRIVYPSDKEIVVTKQKFRFPCFPVIRKALMLKQSGTFEGNGFLYYDNHEDKHYTMSPVESCPDFGVKSVTLYPEDVKSLIQHLLFEMPRQSKT